MDEGRHQADRAGKVQERAKKNVEDTEMHKGRANEAARGLLEAAKAGASEEAFLEWLRHWKRDGWMVVDAEVSGSNEPLVTTAAVWGLMVKEGMWADRSREGTAGEWSGCGDGWVYMNGEVVRRGTGRRVRDRPQEEGRRAGEGGVLHGDRAEGGDDGGAALVP